MHLVTCWNFLHQTKFLSTMPEKRKRNRHGLISSDMSKWIVRLYTVTSYWEQNTTPTECNIMAFSMQCTYKHRSKPTNSLRFKGNSSFFRDMRWNGLPKTSLAWNDYSINSNQLASVVKHYVSVCFFPHLDAASWEYECEYRVVWTRINLGIFSRKIERKTIVSFLLVTISCCMIRMDDCMNHRFLCSVLARA